MDNTINCIHCKIDQFIQITKEDKVVAMSHLSNQNWNCEIALQNYFNTISAVLEKKNPNLEFQTKDVEEFQSKIDEFVQVTNVDEDVAIYYLSNHWNCDLAFELYFQKCNACSKSKEQKIEEFIEIANVDTDVATSYLSKQDWNIGEALETFYQYRSEFSEFQNSLRKAHPSQMKISSNVNQQDKESILEEMSYVTEEVEDN